MSAWIATSSPLAPSPRLDSCRLRAITPIPIDVYDVREIENMSKCAITEMGGPACEQERAMPNVYCWDHVVFVNQEAAKHAYERARQYDALGRIPEAIALYERATRLLPPDHPEQRPARERLRSLSPGGR